MTHVLRSVGRQHRGPTLFQSSGEHSLVQQKVQACSPAEQQGALQNKKASAT